MFFRCPGLLQESHHCMTRQAEVPAPKRYTEKLTESKHKFHVKHAQMQQGVVFIFFQMSWAAAMFSSLHNQLPIPKAMVITHV